MFCLARAETCSPGIAEAGSTLSEPQGARRGGRLPKEKVFSKKPRAEWTDSQTLWRGQKSSREAQVLVSHSQASWRDFPGPTNLC